MNGFEKWQSQDFEKSCGSDDFEKKQGMEFQSGQKRSVGPIFRYRIVDSNACGVDALNIGVASYVAEDEKHFEVKKKKKSVDDHAEKLKSLGVSFDTNYFEIANWVAIEAENSAVIGFDEGESCVVGVKVVEVLADLDVEVLERNDCNLNDQQTNDRLAWVAVRLRKKRSCLLVLLLETHISRFLLSLRESIHEF